MELGLTGKKVAIVAGDDVEPSELSAPRRALEAAGAAVQVVAPHDGALQAKGERLVADCTLDACRAADFDALVVPGGAGAEKLAEDGRAVQLVKEFMLADKPVGAICHGVALLVAADAVAGRRVTSAPDLRERVAGAGGTWEDAAVIVDERLVTGRGKGDVDHFAKAVVREFGGKLAERKVDQLSEASFPASDPPPGPTAIGGEGAAK